MICAHALFILLEVMISDWWELDATLLNIFYIHNDLLNLKKVMKEFLKYFFENWDISIWKALIQYSTLTYLCSLFFYAWIRNTWIFLFFLSIDIKEEEPDSWFDNAIRVRLRRVKWVRVSSAKLHNMNTNIKTVYRHGTIKLWKCNNTTSLFMHNRYMLSSWVKFQARNKLCSWYLAMSLVVKLLKLLLLMLNLWLFSLLASKYLLHRCFIVSIYIPSKERNFAMHRNGFQDFQRTNSPSIEWQWRFTCKGRREREIHKLIWVNLPWQKLSRYFPASIWSSCSLFW